MLKLKFIKWMRSKLFQFRLLPLSSSSSRGLFTFPVESIEMLWFGIKNFAFFAAAKHYNAIVLTIFCLFHQTRLLPSEISKILCSFVQYPIECDRSHIITVHGQLQENDHFAINTVDFAVRWWLLPRAFFLAHIIKSGEQTKSVTQLIKRIWDPWNCVRGIDRRRERERAIEPSENLTSTR